MSKTKCQHVILIVLLTILLTPSLDAQASCWKDYPWGISESTAVKRDWVRTEVSSTIKSYLEVKRIDGGQIKVQYVFLNGGLVQISMTVYSINISRDRLADMIWGPCFENLGQASTLGGASNWMRKDLNTFAVAGIKNDLFFVLAEYIPAFSTLIDAQTSGRLQLIY